MNLEENGKLYQLSQMIKIVKNSSQIGFPPSGSRTLMLINLFRRHVESMADVIFRELSLQMFQFMNESDLYLSYSVKELLVQIYEVFQNPGYEDILELYLKCVIQEMACLFSSSDLIKDHKLLHLLDMMEAIIIKNPKCNGIFELSTLVFDSWKVLCSLIFSRGQMDHKTTFFQNLLHSALKLYTKMIKSKLKYNLNYHHVVDLAEYLVSKLKLKSIPQTCIQKVLEYLFHCCPEFDEVISPNISLDGVHCQKLVPQILNAVTSGLNMDTTPRSISSASQVDDTQHWIYHALVRSHPYDLFVGHGNVTIFEQADRCLNFRMLDLSSLRKLLIFIKKCESFIITCKEKNNQMEEVLKYDEDRTTDSKHNPDIPEADIVCHLIKVCYHGEDIDIHKRLINIYHHQDDAMISFLLYVLQITLTSGKLSSKKQENCIKPNILFLELLSSISWDHSVLVDWLISPETLFLIFLIKQLKFIISNPSQWKKDCREFDIGMKTCHIQMEVLSLKTLDKIDPNCCILAEKPINLTAYSDSEEDDAESTKPPGNSQFIPNNSPDALSFVPSISDTSFVTNECFNTTYGRPKNLHCTTSKGCCRARTHSISCSSPMEGGTTSHKKTSSTTKKLAELIEKLRVRGSFPYNPTPLLKLLARFHADNQASV